MKTFREMSDGELIARLPYLACLEETIQKEIRAEWHRIEHCQEGWMPFDLNNPPMMGFIVVGGIVALTSDQVGTWFCGPGTVLADALINGHPQPYRLTTATACHLLVFGESLRALCQEYPTLRCSLVNQEQLRRNAQEAYFGTLFRSNKPSRIALALETIIQAARPQLVSDDPARCPLIWDYWKTQDSMAFELDISRVLVGKILRLLRAKGALEASYSLRDEIKLPLTLHEEYLEKLKCLRETILQSKKKG